MRILIVATPVAPLGQGKTGGVTAHVSNTVAALQLHGITPVVIALEGSQTVGAPLIEVSGNPQPSLASEAAEQIYPIPADGALSAMWKDAYERQDEFDAILNFAHDWLPYYLTTFFSTPVHHIVNMTDVNGPTSAEIIRTANENKNRVAFMTAAQAARFPGIKTPAFVSFGLDLSVYEFSEFSRGTLLWAGRISPEKGLEDAAAAAGQLDRKLVVAGAVDHETYWSEIQAQYGQVIEYVGYLSTAELQSLMGSADALLQTQKWHEAFGIVTIEAMACGTPVVAFARGANAELVRDGESGLLVEPDNLDALVAAVGQVTAVSRPACRAYVEQHFSLQSYGTRLRSWLDDGQTDQ